MEKTCSSCYYFDEVALQCKFNAPIACEHKRDRWPGVFDDDYCGQWKAREKTE